MKNTLLNLLLAALVVLLPQVLWAGILKGNITDADGSPLPYATVYVKGTTMGTAANDQGHYNLQLPVGTYEVYCQYMGYNRSVFRVVVKGDETIDHDFALREQALSMEDVVISAEAEDPAYAIIRRAIKKRKFHQKQIATFQTSMYMKVVARNRSMPDKILGIKIPTEDLEEVAGGGADSTKLGVVYLGEQEAEYYVDGKRGKSRTIIKSVRESGNPNGVGMSQVPPVISFYDNNVDPWIDANERGFISPISDGALFYYEYEYKGEFVQDDYTINKINVTPKRAYEPLFTGTIYIIDKQWAIWGVDMYLTPRSNLEQFDTLRIRQAYLPLEQDLWVIKNQVLYIAIELFGFDVTANLATVYEKQKVNGDMPDSLFNSRVVSTYLKDANDKDTGHWKEARPIPLEKDEIADYKKKDSIYARNSSPEHRDSVRRRRNKFSFGDFISGGYYHATKEYKHTFRTNSLLGGLVTYNNVEGLAVTPKVQSTHRIDSATYFNTSIGGRYGFGNTHFNGFGRFSIKKYNRSWLTRKWEAGIEGGKYIYQFNPNSTVEPLYNTISILAYGKNLMKLYERYTAAAFYKSNFGNGLQVNLKGGFQRRLPVSNTSFFTFVNDENVKWEPNIPLSLQNRLWEVHNATLFKAAISYRPGYTYVQYPKFKSPRASRWPEFMLSYEKAIPGLFNSKADFDKWRFGVADYVNMKLFGALEYNIAAGGFLNKNYVSLPDMMHIADNEIFLSAPYLSGFQMAPYYKYSNTATLYGEAHVEYNLNGLITNKIPLFRRTGWNFVLGNNTLYTSDNTYYTEAFLSIDNIGYKIIRFLRVDFVYSWDHTGVAHPGIRIGIDQNALGGFAGVSINEDNERFEW